MRRLQRQERPPVRVDEPATWLRYTGRMCRGCTAACCSLPVEVRAADLVRMELIDAGEAEDDLRMVARRLMKMGVVEHYHHRTGVPTLARMANGYCLFLDPGSRRCTIYPRRPDTCRNHPQVGPRSGYCAFTPKPAAGIAA
ncbi:MAG: YkgJ family cysteine cluster protein [Desulfoprunum sp.]